MADSGENNVTISSLFSSKLIKWRVKEGEDVKERTVLALYEKLGQSDDNKGFNLQPKLRSNVNGRIKKLLVAEGDIVTPGQPVIQFEASVACEHHTVMKDLCCDCGMDLRKLKSDQDEPSSPTLATVSMIHNIPELRVTQDEAEEIGKKDEERLLNTRKLALVVDLDQTMIHTTIELVPSDMKDVYHFNLAGYPLWYHTKFRPFAHDFLERLSKLYELHIFTMGSRMYAHTIARMLDPDERLFGHRIRSRDDCFNAFSKSNDLRSLFPRGDSMVCIIDDRTDVWNNAPNLIKVKPYQFFKGVGDINAPTDKQTEAPQSKVKEKVDNKIEPDSDQGSCITQAIDQDSSYKDHQTNQDKTDNKLNNEQSKGPLTEKEEGDAGKKSELLSLKVGKVDQNAEGCIDDSKCVVDTKGEIHHVNDVKSDDTSVDQMVEESTKNLKKGEDGACNEEPMETSQTSTKKEDKQINNTNEDLMTDIPKDESENLIGNDSDNRDKNKPITGGSDKESHIAIINDDNVVNDDTSICNNNNGNKDKASKDRKTSKEEENGGKKTSSDKPSNDERTRNDHIDDDDYLIHLEDVLRRIHDKFYETVDQIKELKAKGIKEADSNIARYCSPGTLTPCTKQIIKQLQCEVLKGTNIVFTGVIPTNIPPEKSDIWQRTERLGARVSRNLVTPKDARDPSDVTTHVIAARLGTEKTYHAIKTPCIKIVKPDWLWSCEERWEWVDERLFTVDDVDKYKRDVRNQHTPTGTPQGWKKAAKTESSKRPSEDAVNSKDETGRERTCSSSSADLLMASLHPLLSFSSTEMEAMDKEVEDLMNSDAEDESDVIGSISGSSSSSSGSSSSSSTSSPSSDNDNDNKERSTKKRKISDSDDDEGTSKKRRDEFSQSDDESDDYTRRSSPSDDDDVDDDDDMAALLEAELSHD